MVAEQFMIATTDGAEHINNHGPVDRITTTSSCTLSTRYFVTAQLRTHARTHTTHTHTESPASKRDNHCLLVLSFSHSLFWCHSVMINYLGKNDRFSIGCCPEEKIAPTAQAGSTYIWASNYPMLYHCENFRRAGRTAHLRECWVSPFRTYPPSCLQIFMKKFGQNGSK